MYYKEKGNIMCWKVRFYFVLKEDVTEKLPFQKICTREDCPNKNIKICPRVLVIDEKPVLEYKKFFEEVSEKYHLFNPCFSHSTFIDDKAEKKEIALEYLLYFTGRLGFRMDTSKLMEELACLNPVF